jgi:hypothetical protein
MHACRKDTIFQKAGVACKPNEEALAAGEFLRELKRRAQQAGGDAPLPPRPDTRHLDDLAAQAGNEQLASLLTVGDQLVQQAQAWDAAATLAAARLPRWQDLQKLLGHAANLTVTAEVRPQVEAIVEQRCLLAEPDPVPPLCERLTQALREALGQAHEAFRQTHEQEMQRLAESELWTKLPEDQRRRILRQQGIGAVPEIRVGTESEVMATLGKMPLGTWHDQGDALPTRFDKARLEAAHRLEPKALSVKLPAATIKTAEDLDLWLDVIRDKILDRLKEGPVIIN